MNNIYDINTKQQINTDTQYAKRLAESVEGMDTFTLKDFDVNATIHQRNDKYIYDPLLDAFNCYLKDLVDRQAVFNTSGLSLGGIEKKDDE